MNKLEKLLFDLVCINSANPDHSALFAAGEEKIGDFIADYFSGFGIECEKSIVEGARANILARVEKNVLSKGKTRNILLCSHLDTVYIEGMEFNPVKKDKNIYGPGSCDTKASLASMIIALVNYRLLKERKANVYFLGAVGEESRHLGIKSFLKNNDLARSIDFCIIGEPTDLNVGIAHKGSLRLVVKTIGRNAHGSMPELGLNAINMMAAFIKETYESILPKYNKIKNTLLGYPTLNIGVINGGKAFNIVPESCYIEIDRRVIPEETLADVISDFQRAINRLKEKIDNFNAEILPVIDYIPFLDIHEKNTDLNLFQETCKKYKHDITKMGMPYATDGGFTSEASIPTIVFGPGNINNCHRLKEFVSIDELNNANLITSAFVSKI